MPIDELDIEKRKQSVNYQLDLMWMKKFNKTPGNKKFYDCPKCLNRGSYMVMNDDLHVVQTECECMPLRRALKHIHINGLDEQVKRCTFDSFATNEQWQKEIKTLAEDFASQEQPRMFYIGGQSGAGKTHICTAIYGKLVIERKLRSEYMLWNEKSKDLIKIQYDDPETFEDIVSRLEDSPVLYIDDFLKPFGDSKPTLASLSLAYDIINKRVLRKDLITIISSEYTLREVREIDNAIAGRIFQACNDKYVYSINKDTKKDARVFAKLREE